MRRNVSHAFGEMRFIALSLRTTPPSRPPSAAWRPSARMRAISLMSGSMGFSVNGADTARAADSASSLIPPRYGDCSNGNRPRSGLRDLRALVFQFGIDRDAIEEVADLDLQNA